MQQTHVRITTLNDATSAVAVYAEWKNNIPSQHVIGSYVLLGR